MTVAREVEVLFSIIYHHNKVHKFVAACTENLSTTTVVMSQVFADLFIYLFLLIETTLWVHH